MDNFNIYSAMNWKYRLLYCLMLNYYKKYYTKNRFNGRILVVCTTQKELMTNYESIYSYVKRFREEDIKTLNKFIPRNDNQLKELYDKVESRCTCLSDLLDGIKKEYVSARGAFVEPRRHSITNIPKNSNILFLRLDDAENLNEKFLIREIFVPEKFELDSDCPVDLLCSVIGKYVKEVIKTMKVLSANNVSEIEFPSLSIFMNSDNGLDIADRVNDYLREYYSC